MTSKKKIALAAVLVLVMVISAIGGTLAYLTDTAFLDNTFTVGVFTPPEKPKPDPDKPDPDPTDPDDPDPTPNDPKVFGDPTTFIFEPYWNANGGNDYENKDTPPKTVATDKHRLLPGDTTIKDPYIGIGKDSEEGYVLACITNPMGEDVYFSLGKGWKPVEEYVDVVTITDENGSPTKTAGNADTTTYYSAGLFMWVGVDGSDNTNTANTLEKLAPTDTDGDGKADADGWTKHPVFSRVYTTKKGLDGIRELEKEQQKMTVWAYIHQTTGKKNPSDTTDTPADKDTVVAAAKAWAKTNDSKHPNYQPPAEP